LVAAYAALDITDRKLAMLPDDNVARRSGAREFTLARRVRAYYLEALTM
jgi:hypothetical protein